jgi:two-component system response regulator AtoC
MPEGLLEAELFGVVKGAFTGADRDRPGLVEQAEGGTLLLDEVGELPLPLQAKLLRLLQEKEVRRVGGTRTRKVDVRFLAATNRDLRQAVRAGTFRQDLYDRLATVTIAMPPLAARLEDLPSLVAELLPTLARQLGLGEVQATGEFLAALAQHTWPGNVRELESVLIQALTRCPPGQRLTAAHLPWRAAEQEPLVPWELAKERFARTYFRALLAACAGNRSRAARLAGISRQVLHYHLRQLGLGESEEPTP